MMAVFSVVTAGLLYRKQNSNQASQFVARKTSAATTTTISDNFNGATLDTAKWGILKTVTTSTAVVTGGKLDIVSSPNSSANSITHAQTVSIITGDFTAEVDISNFLTSTATIGSAVLTIEDGAGLWSSVYWNKSTNSISMSNKTTSSATVINVGNYALGSAINVKLILVRVGTTIQGFADSGSGYVLVSSIQNAFAGDGKLAIGPHNDSTTGNIQTSFDNFTAQVNLVGAPTPVPGSTAACQTFFNVLPLSATPTPFPTPTPTPTPSPTPTPTPTPPAPSPSASATPSPTPVTGCNYACTNNADCPSTLFCYQGACRNASCSTAASCICGGPTPTPSPTPVGASPTPVPTTPPFCASTCTTNSECPSTMICYTGSCRNPSCVTATNCLCAGATPNPTPLTKLTQAGSVAGTWTISIAGIIMVALGALMLAF